MKVILFFLFVSVSSYGTLAQSFNKELEELTKAMVRDIDSKEISSIAVWGFFNKKKEYKDFENYVLENFTVHLSNYTNNFKVIDRFHLDILLKEHYLNYEGLIDEKTAKKLGKVIAADTIIIGSYTISNIGVELRIEVLDTETAMILVGISQNLTMDDIVAEMLNKI